MPLTPLSGSSTPSSPPNTLPTDIPNSQSDILPHMPFVSQPHLNKFAIDTTQYADVTKQLVGFMKGKRVNVTYYRLLNREGNGNRTNIADLVSARHVIDTEYHKILNLEITLPKGFEFTTNSEAVSMSIKGQAMFYPSMNPNVGDMFLIGMGDGRTGVARVAEATPMSWRQDRIYIIDFTIPEFLDPAIHDSIERAVTVTSVFSKENYLGGTAALLSEQTYNNLLKIKQMRRQLCQYFHNTFFDTELSSYIRPDRIYDPWIVKFMGSKISMDDLHIRPKGLLGNVPKFYNMTIWARLEDRYNSTLFALARFQYNEIFRQSNMGVFVTELFNHTVTYPSMIDRGSGYYILGEKFYTGVVGDMTPWELFVYNMITMRTTGDLGVFITDFIDPVFTKTLDDQFNTIPLLVHACDMSLQSQYREIDAPSLNYAENSDDRL